MFFPKVERSSPEPAPARKAIEIIYEDLEPEPEPPEIIYGEPDPEPAPKTSTDPFSEFYVEPTPAPVEYFDFSQANYPLTLTLDSDISAIKLNGEKVTLFKGQSVLVTTRSDSGVLTIESNDDILMIHERKVKSPID